MNKKELRDLKEAIEASREALSVFRTNRIFALKQFVGNHYSDDGAQEEVPTNLIAMYATTVSRSLVPNSPQGHFSTFNASAARILETVEADVNRKLGKIHIDEQMRSCAVDALFLMGILRVALVAPEDAEMYGYSRIAGQACADVVDFDDYVIDHRAKDLRNPAFEGHRFRRVKDSIKKSSRFQSIKRKLETDDIEPFNEDGEARAWTIASGLDDGSDDFEDYVELWQIYLPRTKRLVTFHWDLEEVLLDEEWVGPDCGPYIKLTLGEVPGNLMPKSPIMDLISLHRMYNELVRKVGIQALRQKTLLGFAGGDAADAKRINDTPDGTPFKFDNPDMVKEVSYGGPNQLNMGFIPWLFSSFDKQAGNLSMLGGLGTQSPTATQDKMLEQNASKLVSDYQERTISFAREVFGSFSWFMWNNPKYTMTSTLNMPSGMSDVVTQASPQDRFRIPYDEVDIDINPYSMQYMTPQQKLGALNQIMTQIVLPLAPVLQAQQIVPDMKRYLQLAAKYQNLPELNEILSMTGPEMPSEDMEEPAKPSNTTRTYERVSRPGKMSQQGMGDVMMRLAMGSEAQDSEMAAM